MADNDPGVSDTNELAPDDGLQELERRTERRGRALAHVLFTAIDQHFIFATHDVYLDSVRQLRTQQKINLQDSFYNPMLTISMSTSPRPPDSQPGRGSLTWKETEYQGMFIDGAPEDIERLITALAKSALVQALVYETFDETVRQRTDPASEILFDLSGGSLDMWAKSALREEKASKSNQNGDQRSVMALPV